MEERLQLLLNYYALTGGKFAETIGVQKSSVSHILSGRNNPSFEFIARILDNYQDISPEWLILGKGNMLKKADEKEPTNQEAKSIHETGNTPHNDLFSNLTPNTSAGEPETKHAHKTNQNANNTDVTVPDVTNVNKRVRQMILLYEDDSFDIFQKNGAR